MFVRSDGSPYIIAEIGKNFIETQESKSIEEFLSNAIRLVDAAKASGVNAVKFQTHEFLDEQLNIEIVSPHFKGSDRFNWVKRNAEATPMETFWRPLSEYCKAQGITFFSTPMSRAAAMKLKRLAVPFWKVGSGDIQDYICLNYLLRTRKPIIISTGMVSFEELAEVVSYAWDSLLCESISGASGEF